MDQDDIEPTADPAAGTADPAPDASEDLLTGTQAFEALFVALETTVPYADTVSLGLLLGSNFASFG